MSVEAHILKKLKLPVTEDNKRRVGRALDMETHVTDRPLGGKRVHALVKSQRNSSVYYVELEPDSLTCFCSCPDWDRGAKRTAEKDGDPVTYFCKHAMVVLLKELRRTRP